MNHDESLFEKFPYLSLLDGQVKEIVETLKRKEEGYKGSWKKRGGVGAFMMLARKWDRIEGISREDYGYDILRALSMNKSDIDDDIRDLIGYLLLCLVFTKLQGKKGSLGMENPFGYDEKEEFGNGEA